MYLKIKRSINYLRVEETPNQDTFCKIKKENYVCPLMAMIIFLLSGLIVLIYILIFEFC